MSCPRLPEAHKRRKLQIEKEATLFRPVLNTGALQCASNHQHFIADLTPQHAAAATTWPTI
jgi:hypothetical protein